MSFRSLLRDRVDIERPTLDLSTGSAITTYQVIYPSVRCNMDLQLIRRGRDPIWTPEAKTTPKLRKGVLFFLVGADIQDGDRVRWVRGGSGLFTVERGVDTPKRPGKEHHIEVWVEEVAPQIARGQNP